MARTSSSSEIGLTSNVRSSLRFTHRTSLSRSALLPLLLIRTMQIKGSIGRLQDFRERSRPIPPAATMIHGVADDNVRGCRIEARQVVKFIALLLRPCNPA